MIAKADTSKDAMAETEVLKAMQWDMIAWYNGVTEVTIENY